MAPWKNSLGSAADRLGSAAKRAANSAPTALKRVAAGAASGTLIGGVGVGGLAAAEGTLLSAAGFSAAGPAAGSYAAAWMSSIALGNGVGVSVGSWYAAAQAAAMGGTALVGAPIIVGACVTCALAGVVVMAVKQPKRGESGDAPGPEDSTAAELSAEDSTAAELNAEDSTAAELSAEDSIVAELSADEDVTEGDEHSDEVLGQ